MMGDAEPLIREGVTILAIFCHVVNVYSCGLNVRLRMLFCHLVLFHRAIAVKSIFVG